MNFINHDSYDRANHSTNNLNESQRVSIFSLQKENVVLKGKINELIEEKMNLNEMNQKLIEENKKLFNSFQQVEELTAEIKKKNEELEHNDKFLKEMFLKSKSDVDHINQLEVQIEKLTNQIVENNEELNKRESEILSLKTDIESLKVFKTKYYNLLSVFEQNKKENNKLKKNLDLFSKENHFAAKRIKELEGFLDLAKGFKETESVQVDNQNDVQMLVDKLIEKVKNIQGLTEKIKK